MSNCITSNPSLWNMALHHIKQPQFEPVAFVFPMLNDSPTFPPTSSRQILQLYCPDSRAAGAQATKGRERGWGVGGCWGGGGDGKENGQSGDKRGRNRAPLPWFNLYTHPSYPSPPASTQASALPLQHLSVLLDCPATRDKSANCEWCRLALPGLPGCVWQGTGGRRGTVAMWRERPFSSKAVEEQ